MKDITNRHAIEKIVKEFYTNALEDRVIGHFFTEVVSLNMDVHIPTICDFWEKVLLGTGSYTNNPMDKHFELHKRSHLKSAHFERWLYLWKKTINRHFEGPMANEAINRAKTIAGVMQLKLDQIK